MGTVSSGPTAEVGLNLCDMNRLESALGRMMERDHWVAQRFMYLLTGDMEDGKREDTWKIGGNH